MKNCNQVHLMFRTAPMSYCGLRLRDNAGMMQTFKFNQSTCFSCQETAKEEHSENLETIQRYKEIIRLLKKGNDFYSDVKNWDMRRHGDYYQISREDRESLKLETRSGWYGGKLSRQIKEQVKILESEACS